MEKREEGRERERGAHIGGTEGQNPLVVSLGIPPCGGDRDTEGWVGRGITPFAATQTPHWARRRGPGGVGRDAVVMATDRQGGVRGIRGVRRWH